MKEDHLKVMKEDDKRVMQEDYLNAQSQNNLLLKISWVLTCHNACYNISRNSRISPRSRRRLGEI